MSLKTLVNAQKRLDSAAFEMSGESLKKLLVFDMDGTLVNSFDLIASSFEHAIAEYSSRKLTEEEISAINGYTLPQILAERVPSNYLKEAMYRYHQYFDDHFDMGRVYSGIPEVLGRLSDMSIELAVCTGADRKWATAALRQSKLAEFFSIIMTSDEVNPKPEPEGLIRIMETVGTDEDHSAYVGDEPNDILAAQNASIEPVGAIWGSRMKEEIASLNLRHILAEPEELLTVINSL